jgi:hypothetical protein
VVCVSRLAGGGRACAAVCPSFQGDTKMGGAGKSTECRRPLHFTVPTTDRRLKVEVLDLVDQRVNAVIAQVGLTDPITCPHDHPCSMTLPKGTLALSFGTGGATGTTGPAPAGAQGPAPPPKVRIGAPPSDALAAAAQAANQAVAGTLETSPPITRGPQVAFQGATGCSKASLNWGDNVGLHGPYTTANLAAVGPGSTAYSATRENILSLWEYGFEVLHNKKNGRYYSTPVVRESKLTNPPSMQPEDYQNSQDAAFQGSSCESPGDYVIAATVHTHPISNSFPDNFTPQDFNQSVAQRAAEGNDFEKILVINARTGALHIFTPVAGDQAIPDPPTSAIATEFSDQWHCFADRAPTRGVYSDSKFTPSPQVAISSTPCTPPPKQ